MANSTKKTKQLTFLTLGEKIQIFEYRDNNPKDSFETIAKIFSEKLNKKIQRATLDPYTSKMTLHWHKKVLGPQAIHGCASDTLFRAA